MGLKEKFLNKTIFLDTAPIIYFIEGAQSLYHRELKDIFKENEKGTIIFLTSTLTVMEVLVQPLKFKRIDLAEKYELILTNSPNIEILGLDLETSRIAANLRAKYNLKTPDAIQMASGISSGASMFLTNDKNLSKVKEIKVVVLADECK